MAFTIDDTDVASQPPLSPRSDCNEFPACPDSLGLREATKSRDAVDSDDDDDDVDENDNASTTTSSSFKPGASGIKITRKHSFTNNKLWGSTDGQNIDGRAVGQPGFVPKEGAEKIKPVAFTRRKSFSEEQMQDLPNIPGGENVARKDISKVRGKLSRKYSYTNNRATSKKEMAEIEKTAPALGGVSEALNRNFQVAITRITGTDPAHG